MSNESLAQVRTLLRASDPVAALEIGSSALARARKNFGDTHAQSAIAAIAVGEIELAAGRLPDAITHFESAVRVLSKGRADDRALLADALDGLGLAHAAKGNSAAAESAYCKAVEVREKDLGPDHPLVALALERLAKFYGDGHFEDARAEPLLRRAVDILAAHRSHHDDWSRTLSALARSLLRRGAHAEAEALLRGHIKLERTLHGVESTNAIAPLHEFTLSVIGRGDFERGERLFVESMELLGAETAPNERSLRFETDVADTYRQMGEVQRALGHYRCALVGRRLISSTDDLEMAMLTTRIEELARPATSAFGP
ncbi:MAG: tetratricopeptide repeat protein [Polyangiales bacterium]